MRRIVPALGVPLILTMALAQAPTPAPSALRLPASRPQFVPSDSMPRSYMVYGLKIGANGMVFTDRNGNALPVPSQPHVITNPGTAPRISVPSSPLFIPEKKSPK